MDIEQTKGISILILFVVAFAPGCLPVWLHHRGLLKSSGSSRKKVVLDLFNSFAGGVFLGSGLMHLLVEGREDLNEYLNNVHFNFEFPFYEALVAVGFFLVGMVERLGALLGRKRSSAVVDCTPVSLNYLNRPSITHSGSSSHPDARESTKETVLTISEEVAKADSSERRLDVLENGHHHHSHAHDISKVSGKRALLLLLALCFHSVFDGLAIGLQDTVSEVWQILAAISTHKVLVAACLGMELASANTKRHYRSILLLFVFSIIAPVGIGIGMAVTSGQVDEQAQLLVSGVLQALATGTFLFVTVFEILGKTFGHEHKEDEAKAWRWTGLLEVAFAFVGFGVMGAARLLESD